MKFIILVSFFLILSCESTKNATNALLPNATSTINSSYTEVLSLPMGKIQGIYNKDGSVEIFAGLPFASPPIESLRWKEPEDVIPWDGVYKADHFKSMAMQTRNSAFYNFLFNAYTHQKKSRTYNAPMSEDCLYLNIWKPSSIKEGDKVPVLVYIHGGSLMNGQSWYEKYDGENLAKEGIIVVTIAYRTGVFGYFADEELAQESVNGTTGNYGLLDQIKALEWVNKNIVFFGGDPDNVTIAGESAGSSSVNALCASPLSKGFFRRAIAESSSVIQENPPHTFRTMDEALKMGEDIKKEFKVSSVESLRKIPSEKLIKTKYANNAMTVDGYALRETPHETYVKGLNHEEALLNGFNKREAFAFTFFTKVTKKNLSDLLQKSFKEKTPQFLALYPVKNNKEAKKLYNDVFSAVCFAYPHENWTSILCSQGRPVYEYYFSRENGEIGTNHSGEIIYAYKNVPRNNHYNKQDFELEEIMSSYWLNFIRTGNPNGKDSQGNLLPKWDEVSESGGLLLELGDECFMREDPFCYIYDFLK